MEEDEDPPRRNKADEEAYSDYFLNYRECESSLPVF